MYYYAQILIKILADNFFYLVQHMKIRMQGHQILRQETGDFTRPSENDRSGISGFCYLGEEEQVECSNQ